jgi:hypothetical protein
MFLGFIRRKFEQSNHKPPPQLPYRCGTMLLHSKPEQQPAIFQAWRRAEERYIAFVDAHPRPKREWVQTAAELRQMHEGEDSAE